MKSKPLIRLTSTSFAVLAVLDQCGDATSYELKATMERSIQNFWPVPHTTAYEEPARLAQAGYLSVRQEPAGRRRKVYSLTESGREALREWASEPTAAPPQLRDEMVLKLFAGADPTAMVPERIAWHQAKLAELEGYLDAVVSEEGSAARQRALVAGIAYQHAMLELIERLSAAAATARSA